MDWVSVVSLIISTVISGGIGYFFKRKFEKDRRKFEEDRDKLKREFEKDLLGIKTNFEKEIYTYKARYDHKVEMMKEMFELVFGVEHAADKMCHALQYGEIEEFLTAYSECGDEVKKCYNFFCKYSPFVKKEVIENFENFYWGVAGSMGNVYVFWYERKFLIKKGKKPRYKCGNKYMYCEDIRRDYKSLKDGLRKKNELIKFRNVDEIGDFYFKIKSESIDSLNEQVREYLNEK